MRIFSVDRSCVLFVLCLASSCFIACNANAQGGNSYPQDPNSHFSGTKLRCGDQKRGGSDCWPFHRYHKEMYDENPLWAKCCRPCLGKFGEDLALLDVSMGAKKKIMKRFLAVHDDFHKRHFPVVNLKAYVKNSPSISRETTLLLEDIEMNGGKGRGGGAPISNQKTSSKGGKEAKASKSGKASKASKGGKAPAPATPPTKPAPKKFPARPTNSHMFLTGEEFMEKIKCCHVCPEQFYVPEDYDDPQESRPSVSALLDIPKSSKRVPPARQAPRPQNRRRRRRRLHQSGAKETTTADQPNPTLKESSSQKARKGGDLYWAFHDFYDRQPYTESLEDTKTDFSTNDPNRDTSAPALQPRVKNGACCNICPLEEPAPDTLENAFKIDPQGDNSASFLETMGLPRPNIMGSGATCCPTCPTLQHLVHGPMEPLGGPFQLGNGKLGGDAGTAQMEEINTNQNSGGGDNDGKGKDKPKET
eukprot:g4620.t1